MEIGNIVEYIDRQKIFCAVVLEIKKQRFRLLSENNKEVNFSENRLLYKCRTHIDLSIGRNELINRLKETVATRNSLTSNINIKELWDILHTEQEWIDLPTMTSFCFDTNSSPDHESAVIRAFFNNNFYFKFDRNQFFPYSEEQVEQKIKQEQEAKNKTKIIEKCTASVKKILADKSDKLALIDAIKKNNPELLKILKSYYLYQKDSKYYSLGKDIQRLSGIKSSDVIFDILVQLDVFDENENIDLYLYDIPVAFPAETLKHAANLRTLPSDFFSDSNYKDFTSLHIITIDGQATQDFDDALSIEDMGDYYRLGIHIADVGYYIKKDDLVDKEAKIRGASTYMPDKVIPMLPPEYAENFCSLQEGKNRPAVSIIVNIDQFFNIIDYNITCSVVNIKNRLTYYDANLMVNDNKDIIILHEIAKKFHQYRIDHGSVNITLPNINVWLNNNEEIKISTVKRESPARLLVAEIMIMANWLMAEFLSKKKIHAIYRSQPEPRERIFKGDNGTLFQNYTQRRCLSRFMLSPDSGRHSGLGLDYYITATSPIRKYSDLVTQRQIKAALGMEDAYTYKEIDSIITLLKQPMSRVSLIQRERSRYWLLKYLEKKIGQREHAVIVYKRRNEYQILIPEYMLEGSIPASHSMRLKPEDLVAVTIQHVNARKNIFSISLS